MSRPRFAVVIALTLCALAYPAWAGINFTGGEPTNVSVRPQFMAGADLTNDGRTDVVVVSPQSKEVSVYVAADTDTHFAPARVMRFGTELRDLALGDFNADGRLDVVVSDQASDSIWMMIGQGDGNFLQARQILVPGSIYPLAVATGNFDDSGNLDIAVLDRRLGKVFIMLNDNANPPLFRRGGEINIGEQPEEIRTVDLNGDGKLDIVVLNQGGPPVKEVAVALFQRVAQGFPEFGAPQHYTVGEAPHHLFTGDFNNDGFQDVAMLNKPRGADNNSDVSIMMNRGDGTLNPPSALHVPCPFFTGGAPCKSLAAAPADFDGNGNLDLIVALVDPRRTRAQASAQNDAMQIFSGAGDGTFVPGGVFATQKQPISIAVGDLNTDQTPDIVLANVKTLDVQVFVNTSSPGMTPNGESCLLGEECLSDRCTNGVCCASACDPELFERCNIPGREGGCIPVAEPVECGDSVECLDQTPAQPFCVDGFCCDQECIGGRCDVEEVIGICIPGIPDGEECFGFDEECSSANCCANFVCGRDQECESGFCEPGTGICRELQDLGRPCQVNEECRSNVCDVFDAICCNRSCDPATEICFPGEGICRSITYTPPPRTPTVTPTATFRDPGPNGEDCLAPEECTSGICENNICCDRDCGSEEHCEAGTGQCVPGGPPGTPTNTMVPTPLPTATPEDPCLNIDCPAGQTCLQGLCVATKSSGGCSTGGDDPGSGNLVALALLPLAIWMRRRWQLQRVTVRRRK
jgi:MYXO-CTERM domain-containing protein